MDTRRYVTGETASGLSTLVSGGRPPAVRTDGEGVAISISEVWSAQDVPPSLSESSDPVVNQIGDLGSETELRWRMVVIQPNTATGWSQSGPAAQEEGVDRKALAEWLGGHGTLGMVVVVQGEIVLCVDDDERIMVAGECVVQQGTRHRWENRSQGTCTLSMLLLANPPQWS